MVDAKDHPLKAIIPARKAAELAKAQVQRTDEPKPERTGPLPSYGPAARQALKDEIAVAVSCGT